MNLAAFRRREQGSSSLRFDYGASGVNDDLHPCGRSRSLGGECFTVLEHSEVTVAGVWQHKRRSLALCSLSSVSGKANAKELAVVRLDEERGNRAAPWLGPAQRRLGRDKSRFVVSTAVDVAIFDASDASVRGVACVNLSESESSTESDSKSSRHFSQFEQDGLHKRIGGRQTVLSRVTRECFLNRLTLFPQSSCTIRCYGFYDLYITHPFPCSSAHRMSCCTRTRGVWPLPTCGCRRPTGSWRVPSACGSCRPKEQQARRSCVARVSWRRCRLSKGSESRGPTTSAVGRPRRGRRCTRGLPWTRCGCRNATWQRRWGLRLSCVMFECRGGGFSDGLWIGFHCSSRRLTDAEVSTSSCIAVNLAGPCVLRAISSPLQVRHRPGLAR